MCAPSRDYSGIMNSSMSLMGILIAVLAIISAEIRAAGIHKDAMSGGFNFLTNSVCIVFGLSAYCSIAAAFRHHGLTFFGCRIGDGFIVVPFLLLVISLPGCVGYWVITDIL